MRYSEIGLELLRRRCCWPEVALGEAWGNLPEPGSGEFPVSQDYWTKVRQTLPHQRNYSFDVPNVRQPFALPK